ncbi:MAG TPA: FIST N-terminal domain-containing protein [Candidatus Polarisedimenticolia bacterium]|nr:FIST N-terminal domain-containing protein [Candidatus Polarisedimenticolia bacterium]
MATQAGVGLSSATDTAQAAREAAGTALKRAGVERADWGVIFATFPHRPRYAAALAETQKRLGTDLITGCSAWGVLTGSEEIEGKAAIAVLAVRSDRIRGDALFAPAGDDDGEGAAREIGRRVAGSSGGGLLALWPDPFALRLDLVLEGVGRQAPGVAVIGAAASGDPRLKQTFQFHGRNVATRGLAGLHLGGECRHVVGITQGCQPLGDPCRVTRGEGNVLHELDGEPALEVLRRRLPPILRDSIERLGAHLFVGLPPDPQQDRFEPGEYLVRHMIGADPESGALVVGGSIRTGEPVLLVLREAQAAREDLKRMLARLAPAPGGTPYQFGFYFNCAARGTSLHGLPGIDTAYISGSLPDLPIIGFFGNAEIAPLRGENRLFTHTGVLALCAEEAAPRSDGA